MLSLLTLMCDEDMMDRGFKAAVCSCNSERFETALKESISNVLEMFDSIEKLSVE